MAEVQLKDGAVTTYSASVTGLVGVAGDMVTLKGAAGKVIRLTRVSFSGIATAAAETDLTLVKRSAADTGGTSAGMTAVPHRSDASAASASALSYTVAPTPGAVVGTIRTAKASVGAAATGASALPVEWKFGDGPKQCPTLLGAAEQFALNISATNAGALYNVDLEWTEDIA